MVDGVREHLLHENLLPILFKTRSKARQYASDKYGYIKTSPDLREEPHGWRMPIPVRVTVMINAALNGAEGVRVEGTVRSSE